MRGYFCKNCPGKTKDDPTWRRVEPNSSDFHDGTEAGREANRRIEFSLIVPEEEADSDTAAEDGEDTTTDEQDNQ